MHTRASNSELVEPLPKPERILNQRHRRRNRRVSFDQRNNLPKNPRIVYPPILNINHFRDFLNTLENLFLMDDEPMWATDRVVALTPGSAITIPETANEFAIKDTENEAARLMMFPLSLAGETKNMVVLRKDTCRGVRGQYLTVDVLGGTPAEETHFIIVWVFLEGTPARGTYSFLHELFLVQGPPVMGTLWFFITARVS
ncbi:hypothetical protein Tco_0686118 [Tanacetum coccineum]